MDAAGKSPFNEDAEKRFWSSCTSPARSFSCVGGRIRLIHGELFTIRLRILPACDGCCGRCSNTREYVPLSFHLIVFLLSGLTNAQIRYTISEELEIGTAVGDIVRDLGLELRKLSTRRIRISSDHRRYFNIDHKSGKLVLSDRLDRETLCDFSGPCLLSVEVVVENPLEVHNVDLEPPTGGKHIELVLKKPLDREQAAALQLILTAMDGGTPSRTGTAKINVRVLDTNDNAPVFDSSVYKVKLWENSPAGTLVIKLNATDRDEGTNGEVYYSFSSYPGKSPPDIDSVTGVVRVTGLMDYEESSAHELDVRAKDGGGQSSHCKLIIDVIDVNDNVPIVSVKSASASVAEDSYSGAMVALLNVHDPDTGAGGRVSCYISDNVPFRLISEVKNYFMLVTDDVLDRETHSHFNITVTAADDGSPPLMSSEVISISVADVNDNAPIFTHSFYDAEVPENQPRNTPVVRVSAEDRDLGKNAKIKYSLSSHADFFSVDADTGNVFTVRPFDHETLNYFQIDVTATDGGDPSLTGHCTVRILVTDQNDNAPVILYPVQSNGSIAEEMVPLAAPEGYLVTKVVAVDADVGHNAWLSYRIVQTSQPNLFSVGIHCGEIRTLRPFTEDDVNKHAIVVSVKDNGAKSLSATATVRIAVGDTAAALDELSGLSTGVQMDSDFTLHLLISLAAVCVLFLFLTGALVCFGRRKPTFYRESVSNLPVFPPTYSRRGYSSQCATLHDDSRSDWFLTTGSWKGDFRFGSGVIDYDAIRGKSVAPPKNKIVVRVSAPGRETQRAGKVFLK
uniref:Cadherin domain-containing protein n=1 Tax=Denticeps clupeoides TaxID=299321 RepID=A0AAY4DHS9_9TELE